MIIPVGNSQVNHIFGGPALETGGQVTYGVDNSTGKTPADIAEELHTLWEAQVLGIQTTELTILSTLVKNGPNDTGPSASFSHAGSGGGAGSAVPSNVALLVTKNTAMGGRQGRGRLFIPSISETDVTAAGALSGGALASYQGAMDDFFDGLVAADLPMILLRSENSPAQPPETVTSLTVQGIVATQRRRLRR